MSPENLPSFALAFSQSKTRGNKRNATTAMSSFLPPPSPPRGVGATLLLLLAAALLPDSAHAILPTAAIDVFLPDTAASNAITLFASQASFGGSVARFDQRYHHFEEAGSSGKSRIDGVGVVPAFPPENDAYLCNESEEWADYSSNGSNGKKNVEYLRSALLVPRGQCSFEHKALSAQRLGASAIIIYGTMGSRYSLNYTNSTDDGSTNDAKTREGYTRDDVLWPHDKLDYDCDFGRAMIPKTTLGSSLDFLKMPGGYNPQNDAMLMGTSENNLCVKYDDTEGDDKSFVGSCNSQRCLVTGRNSSDDGGDNLKYEACCAWDFHVWLYADASIPKDAEDVTIPAVFVTMGEAAELLDLVRGAQDGGGDPVVMSIYQRYRPEYNVSAVLIWAFGVFVAWIASYHSSLDIRRVSKAIVVQREMLANIGRDGGGGGSRQGEQQRRGGSHQQQSARPRSRSNSPSSASNGENANGDGGGALEMASNASTTNERANGNGQERTIYREESAEAAAVVTQNVAPRYHDEEALELTSAHALGFVVMASTSLLVLFFFKIYNVVKIMYAFGCSGAFAQIVVHPGLTYLSQRLRWERPLKPMKWLSEEAATREALRGGCKGRCLNCLWSFFGPVSPVDMAAVVLSYGVGAAWLYVAFTVPHPDTIALYWIVQDVFGVCMCMLFLETIKLNAIKVGAVLLVVAFFYDIFFVFVTPLLTKHGESIMVNVATSGGPPKADPSWCEKYPFASECKGGDPLPMLFAIPRIGDYQGGCSMLGLGDIVLPGLLLSFASRYDESKRLIGLVSGGSGRVPNNACPDSGRSGAPHSKSSSPLCFLCCCCRGGYFGPVVVAYAIGLLMANAAVYIMEMGQPALLYLVPCCLGTMMYMGHRAGELNDLWEGPSVIRAADRLMYGESRVENAEEDCVVEEGGGERLLEDGMSNEEGAVEAVMT
eukprot:CAMPEP_0172528300 /NCGR_PEP_ID=MMETSP1067-20121228/2733_1 /TAXON_ID=265564 ORGANISM="Thalassiosira punctigera, Strain Tpunct2005C2" /NCGR_SAMPLE_ID=MMETSP1067 /ASSEMBLY_ACC=CAM_ASM_000444 /LENGTH=938 /DNA_ID=CAMNT_0013312187 /DNA_START=96 /DNA_END=2912 /DNA_ORIENTATION=+